MWSIAKKEFRFYFSHLTGYLVLGSYLIINTLLLWFFDTPYNVMNSGFGDLSPFFEINPWLFLFLIPALSMRSFSEEKSTGTYELLLTKPLRSIEIFSGKFLGVLLILLFALFPTTLNIVAINALLEPGSSLDWGSLLTSYMALLLIGVLFISFSLCSSLLFRNQVASFLVAALVCFTQFFVWEFIASLTSLPWLFKIIEGIGINTHYASMSRGILKGEDLIYFIGWIYVLFLLGTALVKSEHPSVKMLKKGGLALIGIIFLMIGSESVFLQFDLTKDQRYSLSQASLDQLELLDEHPLRIDVFLAGDLPTPYVKFRNELDALLNQLRSFNKNCIIQYNNPFEFEESEAIVQEMRQYGMPPEVVFENKNGNRSEQLIFPWMIVNYGDRSERIALLQKQLGDTENQKIIRSLQQLEYQIMDGIYKVSLSEKKNIAVLGSHSTSDNLKITDLLQNLKPYYNLATFDLKNLEVTPEKSLENLKRFELLLVSNPREPFTQTEKFILDQYGLQGGKLLWLVNGMGIDRDSLFNQAAKAYALPLELNIDDYFFNKGLRIQKSLIQDLYCAPIVLASGSDNNTQYLPYPWVYYPLSEPEETTIGKDLGPVWSQFASPIESLPSALEKTLLLQTSAFTKTPAIPTLITLEQATTKIKPSLFDESSKHLGYLIKGTQSSLFKNRIKPFNPKEIIEEGTIEMIVFSDGNLAENQIEKGTPLALGYDKWTNNFYANRSLLMNAIHYLTANIERLELRQKDWNIPLLDSVKMGENASFWKSLLLLLPCLIIFLLGWINQWLRSKHFSP